MTTTHLARCIALALACAGAGHAQAAPAVSVNPLGLGQVLLYPYYTVNGGNDTYLSVVNTTPRGKAAVLRFFESRNSRTVLEFSLYLSPYDAWTAALLALDGNGPANLITLDASCTVPAIRGSVTLPQLSNGTRYVAFRNFLYAGTDADGGPTDLARAREGHFELIEMGTLGSGAAPTQVAEEVRHDSEMGWPNSGMPVNCGQPIANWDTINGAWGGQSGNRQLDIGLPEGGLYGSATIIDVANGTLHTYEAVAITGFYGGSAAPGGLHFPPGSGRPTLADASQGGSTIDTVVTLDNGESIRSTWHANSADAVSAVLMQDSLYDEFDTEATIAGASEWVLTYPTKRFYAAATADGTATAPFHDSIRYDFRTCDPFWADYWDREELPLRSHASTDQLSDRGCPDLEIGGVPPPPPLFCAFQFNQCNGTNLISFNQAGVSTGSPSAIFGTPNGVNFDPRTRNIALDRGHLRINFSFPGGALSDIHRMTSLDGDVYTGLPVIGFWSANYVNAAAQAGKLANYSGAVRHRGSRNVTGS